MPLDDVRRCVQIESVLGKEALEFVAGEVALQDALGSQQREEVQFLPRNLLAEVAEPCAGGAFVRPRPRRGSGPRDCRRGFCRLGRRLRC